MRKLLLCILFLLPNLVLAAACLEGKDYLVISNPEPNLSLDKPLVTEFFSYGCPGCYKIEPQLNQWLQQVGQTVRLNKVPVIFHAGWELYAKAYYTAKILALSNKINPILFKAIQEDKKILNTQELMVDFLVMQGLDKEIIRSAFSNSSTIDTYINNGTALMARYQITGVPAFVINNKYKTDLKMAGSPEHLLEVLDYLVRKKG
jgi:thiol:disulfide interchange protein DsbA